MTLNSMQHPPGYYCRFVLAGAFREASLWAARADLSLREWTFIETDAPLRIYELVIDPDPPITPAR
jgi:hypothetical protein